MSKKIWIFSVLLIMLALAVAYFFDTGDGPPYSVTTATERGASLLYDTLRHMGYPVEISRRPLVSSADVDAVYVMIQPRAPQVLGEVAEEILEWVREGGRLVFLCRLHPRTHIGQMSGAAAREIGDFRMYRIGRGELVTARAAGVTNHFLMSEPSHGQIISNVLDLWHSERDISAIVFAEYYHGFHSPETAAGALPLVIRLMLAQMLVLAVVLIWHLGKRFGNPMPAYTETEREENEYVSALARLYMESDRRKKK